jgi:hypothetical protein
VTDRETAVLDAATVDALARLLGYPPLDADTASRIAAGASNAVAAVRATATVPLFDAEPGNYLAELERLAGPGP